jgi:hypothetical protein
MEWARELAAWWKRRRRFAEEWAFHRDMAISEFESLGMSRREARQLARRRLGGYFHYRRAALAELRSDYRALLHLLPRSRVKKSPFLVPAVIAVTAGLMLAFNPQRLQVIESLSGLLPFAPPTDVARLVPLTPRGVVPTGFAAVTLWAFALIAIARMAAAPRLRAHWRTWMFGGATLLLLIAFSGIFWATALQILLGSQWTLDRTQGAAMVAFLFAYVGWAFAALRFWYRDLESRCPFCLRRLGMPEVRGNAHDVLISPLETETVCLHGHGLNLESHWGPVFAPDHST